MDDEGTQWTRFSKASQRVLQADDQTETTVLVITDGAQKWVGVPMLTLLGELRRAIAGGTQAGVWGAHAIVQFGLVEGELQTTIKRRMGDGRLVQGKVPWESAMAERFLQNVPRALTADDLDMVDATVRRYGPLLSEVGAIYVYPSDSDVRVVVGGPAAAGRIEGGGAVHSAAGDPRAGWAYYSARWDPLAQSASFRMADRVEVYGETTRKLRATAEAMWLFGDEQHSRYTPAQFHAMTRLQLAALQSGEPRLLQGATAGIPLAALGAEIAKLPGAPFQNTRQWVRPASKPAATAK